ncbi:hypothetical protein EJ357_47850 [Streptomyces cyaneochromogenes]|uniref:Uncharacterized protein n=1 Tax=Streptomyces cyaneochromogenes TaxID=2496836 RepID=A0A3S5HT41_9ACTN|nr:hypothetical protein [Streptomyces cyaneochromogenes]AZQ32086.1 hypothetical protein EJ357_00080 [Streptomyces cyaneochromogenes]AZQ40137.1 hypothetical protein EJ357_47850 [Streptomyces cyaneochromogenes]
MDEHLVALEKRMQQLQEAIRQALTQHDNAQASRLGAELTRTQHAWNVLCGLTDVPETARPEDQPEPAPTAAEPNQAVPVRDQVHQALALLTVPASPKLLSQVHQAFFSSPLNTARLTTLRRDEERSFRSAPYGRAYYICPALTSDLLSPARGLLALSTWPLQQRLVGPLTQRVHFLTAALRLADAAEHLSGETSLPQPVQQLLLHYSRNIHGDTIRSPRDLDALRRAAAAELEIHAHDDADHRAEAAQRARQKLGDAEQIFGNTLRNTNRLRRTS